MEPDPLTAVPRAIRDNVCESDRAAGCAQRGPELLGRVQTELPAVGELRSRSRSWCGVADRAADGAHPPVRRDVAPGLGWLAAREDQLPLTEVSRKPCQPAVRRCSTVFFYGAPVCRSCRRCVPCVEFAVPVDFASRDVVVGIAGQSCGRDRG
jgi:hypothetical protein